MMNQSNEDKTTGRATTVFAKTPQELQRALEALANFPNSAKLPPRMITEKTLRRIVRDARAAERAQNVPERCVIADSAEIRVGKFMNVLSDVEDESVQMIVTDPPYGIAYLSVWDDLGAFAQRVLVPGGMFVSYSGQAYIDEVLARLKPFLKLRWIISLIGKGPKTAVFGPNVNSGWKPILVYQKPPVKRSKWIHDVIYGTGAEKSAHEWQQGEGEAAQLIRAFSMPGDLIIDPCVGSGTVAAAAVKLGRRIIASDIDPVAVQQTRDRIDVIVRPSAAGMDKR